MSKNHSTLKKALLTVLAAVMCFSAVALPGSNATVSAQSDAIVLSLPSTYESYINEETLAPFEQQYSVRVHVEYTGNNIRFGVGAQSTIDERLEDAAELAATGDVVYVSQSTLTTEATQAGYFLNLAPLANSDPTLQINDFYPAVWDSFQWDQGVWALPIATDVIVMTYEPEDFDAAGLAYPNERWTMSDLANAARVLTTYNNDGSVLTAGVTAASGGSTFEYVVRALSGNGYYDNTAIPNTPDFTNPQLEADLTLAAELVAEGVLATTGFGGEDDDASPLTVVGSLGMRQLGTDTTRQAVLLPGSTAGLSAQGFAVSSGSYNPEAAYALAAYITLMQDMPTDFTASSPARQSMVSTQDTADNNNQGGGPGRGRGSIPTQMQPVIEQAMYVAMPGAEMRYTDYLSPVITEINAGTDAATALQNAQATAISEMQEAVAAASSTYVTVVQAPAEVVLSGGEIELNCAYNTGTQGGRGGGNVATLPNEDDWQIVIDGFVASNPSVGHVNLEPVSESDMAVLAESYDCFILTSNAVQGGDVSPLLNLDPMLDTDATFDRNDVLPGILTQLQQDNMTWAIPMAVQPQMMAYSPSIFQMAGVPEPANGWTTDAFIDALQMLTNVMEEGTAPFNANDPSGAYFLMLVGAFGGVPMDYRTDPPTLNFTDTNTVNAMIQVLNLAKDGYIQYDGLASIGGGNRMRLESTPAITTEMMNNLTGGGGQGRGSNLADETVQVLYPQSTQAGFVALDITTGYVSSNAEYPEVAYQFLSTAANNPALFSGLPARSSQASDPAVIAAQGEETMAVFSQLEAILRAPGAIVVPSSSGTGGQVGAFLNEFWIKQAFDEYVLNDGDFVTALQDAQVTTEAFLECIEVAEAEAAATVTNSDDPRGGFQYMMECAQTVDPDMAALMGG